MIAESIRRFNGISEHENIMYFVGLYLNDQEYIENLIKFGNEREKELATYVKQVALSVIKLD